MKEQDILEVTGLTKSFPIRRGFSRRVRGQVRAVDGVSFTVGVGETLGLVGESGCGKTTTGRCILRAIEPSSGKVEFRRNGGVVDVLGLEPEALRLIRQEMQLIFQDPYSSLNPRMTVREIIGEPLLVNGIAKGRDLDDQVAALMRRVGLRPEYMRRYPHAFSGGQRQRIGIARSLALKPRFVVCDEAVSALDVSIQTQILNLLMDLQQEYRLSYLFIAHDLGVVEQISDRVAVMYLGRIVELAEAEELFVNPRHPYTEALLSAVPKLDPRRKAARIVLEGEVGDASNPPPGCPFHPRCRYAAQVCGRDRPAWRAVGGLAGHQVACHLADDLKLHGVDLD